MKHLYLITALIIALATSGFAQSRYSASGGLLGALNYSSFRTGEDNVDNRNYQYKLGVSGGIWFNLPLSAGLSVEPQLMYSLHDYEDADRTALLPSGRMSYFSIPLLLKFHPNDDWAISLGPQFDFLNKLHRVPSGVTKDDFASTTVSLGVGLELFPHEPLVLFARYVHGFTNLDEREATVDEYYNSNFQFGFKLNLFGKPADSDGDGIIDADDECPTVFGLASLQGCPDSDSDGITDASDDCPLVAGIVKYKGCPIPDTDKDGINDENDKCPTVVGVSKYDGCPIPDTDADGINDDNDKCPTVAGLDRYNGCPIPDTDGDGINDELDKCPSVAGLAQFDGCPNPDRDMDGVPNETDLCPDIKGPASNDGCPVVESPVFNTRMIQFVSGSAELTARAKRDLKEGANLLNSGDFAKLKIEIQGHTDHVGSSESNHTLSHKRAESVRAELIKNGVSADRLTVVGYGEDRPIADNSTSEGRALNRRVELKARQ